MDKKEWYQIGEDIKKQVQMAIDTNDYTKLSKNISETVGVAFEDFGKNLNDAVNSAALGVKQSMQQASAEAEKREASQTQKRQKWERYQGSVYYAKPNTRPDPKLFTNSPKGKISGPVYMLLGFGTMGIGAIAALRDVLWMISGVGSVFMLTMPITAIAAGTAVGTYGVVTRQRAQRFLRYVDMVKEKLYCSVEELAGKTGRSSRYVRRDLKNMMRKGMFLQAHFDKKENCFIASDTMYEQYMLTQKQYEESLRLECKTKQTNAAQSKTSNAVDAKAQKVLEEGRAYIVMIRTCNDEIPGEEMSEKLDKLEMLVTRIFARVEEEPEQADELQKLLRYYLPTTQKLLEAYRDLERQNVESKNIVDTKREIEITMDTINAAFEKFLDELFRDKAWDIQSDISVLNTMLKQDGYIKSDFEKGKGSGE